MKYTYSKNIQKWLHFVRYQETVSCLKLLPEPPLKILEIGGGDGYIASIFSEYGYDITSIDIQPRYPTSFPVQKMNADYLIFPENTFDVIFSSNVLEHIKDLPLVINEMKKVAKKDALFIFVLPTPAWRLITSVYYILRLFRIIFLKLLNYIFRKRPGAIITNNSFHDNPVEIKKVTFFEKIKQLILHPHGEYPSFLHEIYYFSYFRWKLLFKKNCLNIVSYKKGPLFYSGVSVFKFRLIKVRKFLAEYFFSSGHIYLLKSN